MQPQPTRQFSIRYLRHEAAAAGPVDEFRHNWRYDHPLTVEQLAFAGRPAVVRTVGYYHGGDALYESEGSHGIWHEQCLVSPD